MSAGHVVSGVVAVLFLYSASFKLQSRSGLSGTLVSLGVSNSIAGALASSVTVGQLATALAVLGLAPRSVALSLALVAAVGIGTAGVIAMRRDEPVPCSCFSESSESVLGPRQLAVAGALVGAVGVIWGAEPEFTLEQSLASVAIAALCCCALHIASGWNELRELAQLRRAAAPAYPA